jgi:hypothetical protein
MLARSFLTAADLGISEIEHDALIKVLHMLERGELKHRPDNPSISTIPNAFSMGHWGRKEDCGSIGCIRGWARFVANDDTLFARPVPDAVYGLFTVEDIHDKPWTDITPAEAAHAVSNYLTTGASRWKSVLAATD